MSTGSTCDAVVVGGGIAGLATAWHLRDLDVVLPEGGEPAARGAGYGTGYFHLAWNRGAGLSRSILGGPGRLVEALAWGLEGRIRLGAAVTQVVADRDGVVVHYREGGVEHELRAGSAV